ncbi:MAG: ABC transporter permease [Candidatus Thorarchaeota archaeon]
MSRFRDLVRFMRLELSLSYRSPILEGVFGIFFLLVFMKSLQWSILMQYEAGYSNQFFEHETGRVLFSGLYSFSSLLPLLISLIAAITLAKPFEDGMIKTILTYPLSRSTVFLGKILLVVLVFWTAVATSYLASVFLVLPYLATPLTLALILLGIFVNIIVVVSFIALIAFISRRTSITALFGLGFWFLAPSIFVTTPVEITTMFLPIFSLGRFFQGESAFTYEAVTSGFLMGFIFALVLLLISFEYFRRSEI